MPRQLRSLVLLTSLSVVACQSSTDDADAPAADQAGAEGKPEIGPERGAPNETDPRLAGPIIVSKAVPADVGGVVVVRTADSLFETATELPWLGPRDPTQYKALADEVDAYLRERVGVTLTGTSTLTMFYAQAPDRFGLIVDNVEGDLTGAEHGRHGDTTLRTIDGSGDMLSAKRGTALLIGNAAGVAAMLDGLDGKTPALADDREGLGGVLTEHSAGASLAVVTELAKLPPDIAKPAAQFGVERAYFGITDGSIRLMAFGTPAGMKAAQQMIQTGIAQAQGELEKEAAKAMGGDDVFMGIAMITGTHTSKRVAAALEPKVDGGRLTIEVPLMIGGASGIVAVMGVAAAVAVPALQKYMRRAKTSEAKVMLAKAYDGAAAYFNAEHVQEGMAPHQCPNDDHASGESGITPPLSVNCNDGPGGRCIPAYKPDAPGYYDIALWTDNPVWKGMALEQETGHYFHYNFIWTNEATGYGKCQFTIQAFADLDDDGVYSTYERYGAGDQLGVNAAVGLYIDNEIE